MTEGILGRIKVSKVDAIFSVDKLEAGSIALLCGL